VAIGILGATVMPHNLYLHSALVQSRRIGKDEASRASACRFYLIDSAVALNAAFFVNAAILVVSAAAFGARGVQVDSIEKAYELLTFLGPAAPILFAIALLCAGQSSTLTGTLAGQIVMEGYLNLKIAPWLRRLITRLLALVPAVLVIGLTGEESTQELLVLSQVILSLQLSFAVIPLIHFTSNRRNMGVFATPWWGQLLAWAVAAIIVGLNGYLVVDQIQTWIAEAEASGIHYGPIPLSWLAAVGLIGVSLSVAGLLLWVLVKPIIRPSPAWSPPDRVTIDWDQALRPHPLATIGVALEHKPGDVEILNRAISLAQTDSERRELVLLHVVDSAMTVVHGDMADDLETEADAAYLDDLVQALHEKGFRARAVLLHGADPAARIIEHLHSAPVDLLVVGSHGHGLIRDLLYGQTVDRVRHNVQIPMLIARSDRS
jgi:manganese transport protein